jgi:DNA-binding transcriptional MerR regulator
MLPPMAEDHVTIGQFARRTGVSAKALRHYDELGLLRPARVDPDTGYRLYTRDQIPFAEAIRRLRELDMPLGEIAVLMADPTPERVHDALVAHRARVAGRHAELQVALTRLQPLIDGKEPLMGDTRAIAIDDETRRRLAADLFNRVWTLMETEGRTPEQDDEMLHAAHASRFHWGEVGGTPRLWRGEWQCSRVYAVLGRPEPSLHHARRCLELCEGSPDAEDWDLPFAHEALSRAHALAGDVHRARLHHDAARELATRIADPEDRALVESDLASIPLVA